MGKNKPGSTKMWKKNGEDGRGTSDNNIYSFSSVPLKNMKKRCTEYFCENFECQHYKTTCKTTICANSNIFSLASTINNWF